MAGRRHCPACGHSLPPRQRRADCPHCGALVPSVRSSAAPAAPEAPARLGPWELGRKIAEIPGGSLHEGRRVDDRQVAWLSRLHLPALGTPPPGSPDPATRLERLSQLEHPALPRWGGHGREGESLYLAFAPPKGSPLRGDGSQPPLPPTLAARVVEQLAEALHEAHTRGLVHFDLQPSQVWIAPEGTVTLLGLEGTVSHDIEASAVEQLALRPPETLEPEPAPPSVRGNVYSLGALLHLLLIGIPPFRAATARDTLRLIQEETPAPANVVNPLVPEALAGVVCRCLRKAPSQRFSTTRELALQLDRYLRGEPLPAAIERACRDRPALLRRHPLQVLAGLLVVGGLTAALVWSWDHWHQLRRDHARVLLTQAAEAIEHGRRGEALQLARTAGSLGTKVAARRQAIRALALPELPPVAQAEFARLLRIDFHPNLPLWLAGGIPSATPAAASRMARVRVFHLTEGRPLGSHEWNPHIGPPAFHPSRAWVAIPVPENRTVLWTPDRGGGQDIPLPAGGRPLFSPEGRRLALVSATGTSILDLESFHAIARAKELRALCWLNSDSLLVERSGTWARWIVPSGETHPLPARPGRLVAVDPQSGRTVWWDEAGRQLSFGSITLRDVAAVATIGDPAVLAPPVWLFPGGRRALARDALNPAWMRLLDLESGRAAGLLAGPAPASIPWTAPTEPEVAAYAWTASDTSEEPGPLALSPDGRHLAYTPAGSKTDPALQVVDLRQGRSVAELPGCRAACWSADGCWLATITVRPTASGASSAQIAEARAFRQAAPDLPLDTPPYPLQFGSDDASLWAGGRPVRLLTPTGWLRLESGEPLVGRLVAPGSGSGHWSLQAESATGLTELEARHTDGQRLRLPLDGGAARAAFFPDGRRLLLAVGSTRGLTRPAEVAASMTNRIEVWDLDRGRRSAVWSAPARPVAGGPLACSPDGRFVAEAFFDAEEIRLLDAGSGGLLRRLRLGGKPESGLFGLRMPAKARRPSTPPQATALAFDAQGRRLFAGFDDGSWSAWSLPTGRPAGFGRAGSTGIRALAVSPARRLLALSDREGRITLWDATAGRRLADWRMAGRHWQALAFSPDGALLAAGSAEGWLQVWPLGLLRRELARLGLEGDWPSGLNP